MTGKYPACRREPGAASRPSLSAWRAGLGARLSSIITHPGALLAGVRLTPGTLGWKQKLHHRGLVDHARQSSLGASATSRPPAASRESSVADRRPLDASRQFAE